MRLARPLLALLLPGLLAGGCGTTPDAADMVADRATSGPTVTEAEAAGALLDYADTVDAALSTGDTAALDGMSGPECPCRDLVALVETRFARGAELVGASFDMIDVTVQRRRGSRARVSARVTVSEYRILNADGLRIGTQPQQEFSAVYTVQRDGDTWTVVDVERR